MEIKKIDGEEYILKSSVDELVRKRLSPMSERARKAESTITELQKQLDGSKDSASRIQEHQQRIQELENEISKSRAQYHSHSTIASHGFTDPNLRDMVEWTYQREMANRPKKAQQKLDEWITEIKENPDLAPVSIRPHLRSTNPVTTEQKLPTTSHNPQVAQTSPPPSNNAVVQTNGTPPSNLLENALRDPEMYRAKREEIKATWYAQRNRKPFM